MPSDSQKVRSIFQVAVEDHAPQEWAGYLDEACAGDPHLRRQVEVLLRAHGQPNSLLDGAPRALAATADRPLCEGPGTVIGPYKLLEQIGEGGFGVVFMAEQLHPVRRKVALKVVKPGMDTRPVIARFEAERQALALMDHPNIAHVLDGGETTSGRPYFVMELVRGVALTDFCDLNHLPIRERLELFVHVCQAVQHAHHKGIIHRDLKPSNILVTLHDGVPVVKVIDFGIAKALGQQLTDKTLFTNFAQMIGTPLYMSPEQAEMSGLDVDTRSDIYSLGVLLYELLTGTTPYDQKRLRTATYDEIRRIIREEDPPRPSKRISALGETLKAVSAQRNTDPRRLSQLCHGELDWIVMKALEKDRNRRYDTASAFAADVQRYLADEPVLACPPSALYKLRKLARRHKAAFGVAALLLVLLLSLGLSYLLRRDRDRARTAQGRAERAEQEARGLLARAQNAEREVTIRAHLAKAAAIRHRGDVGQRFGCLAELAKALKLNPSPSLREEIRTEAIAALALPDLEVAREWDGFPAGTAALDFDDTLERFVRLDKQGGVAVCRLTAAGEEVTARIPAHGRPPFRGPWLSRDGQYVLVGHRRLREETSAAFRVWKLNGPRPESVLDERATVYEQAVAFRPGGRQLAVGHLDGSVSIYDLPTGRRIRRLRLGTLPHTLAFNPKPGDGRLAVACGNAVRLFDVDKQVERPPLRHPKELSWTTGLAWHPDGRRLATACDTKIFLWDTQTARELTLPWEGHVAQGIQLAFNHAGDRLLSRDWDAGTRLWDAVTGRLLLRSPHYAYLRFSRDTLLGPNLNGKKVRLYRVAAGHELRMIRRPIAGPKETIFSPVLDADGRILAAGSRGRFSFFDFARGEELASVRLPQNSFAYPLRYHRRHGWLMALSEEPGENVGITFWPCRWGPPGSEVLRIGPSERLATGDAAGAGISADGRVLGVPQGNAGAVVVHLDQPGKEIHLGPQRDVRNVAVSPDGRLVVTCSHWRDPRYKNARIWDAATGRHVHDLPLESSSVAAFSPNGRWLATSSVLGSSVVPCRLWEVQTWRVLRDFGHASIAFSPDSRLLALDDVHGLIRLVTVETGREVARLTFPEPGWYRPVCFSPDGAHLITQHGDLKALYVWDLRALRRQLKAMDLDWSWPELPRTNSAGQGRKLPQVEVLPEHPTRPARTREEIARRAIERYRRAVAASPDSADACNSLAWTYLTAPEGLRDAKAALPLSEKAVRLASGDAVYRNTLGVAYYRAGRYREAVRALRRNLPSQADWCLAFDLYFLAMSHHRLGEVARARDCYALAVRWTEAHRELAAEHRAELAAFRAETAAVLEIDSHKD
jgi:serine/threonine protein kinase/WD40 repeat protein